MSGIVNQLGSSSGLIGSRIKDITNKIDAASSDVSADATHNKVYYLGGFVFLNLLCTLSNPSGNVDIFQINDSNYYPDVIYRGSNISYQGDSVNSIIIRNDNGKIIADSVNIDGSSSDATFRIQINMWYKKVT